MEVTVIHLTSAYSSIKVLRVNEDMKDVPEVEIMVEETCSDNYTAEDKRQAFLFYAAKTGDWESLAKFFESGEFDEANLEGVEYPQYRHCSMTPLHVAAKHGHVKCAQMFIDSGTNVDSKDVYNRTSLHIAAINGKSQCLKLLLEAGADISACTTLPFDVTKEPYNSGVTALHLAAKYKHADCIKELIRFGANCSATDEYGYTSLHIAVCTGVNECVLAHLSNIQDTDFLSMPCSTTSNTALHTAIQKEMTLSVKELVRSGADVNRVNRNGMSPIQLMSYSESYDFETRKEMLKVSIFEGRNADLSRVFQPRLYNHFNHHDIRMKAFLIACGANEYWPCLSNYTLFESELHSDRFPNLLKFMVNFIPSLPFLHKFDLPYKCSLPKPNVLWLDPFLPDDMKFELVQIEDTVFIKMYEFSVDINEEYESFQLGRVSIYSFQMLIPLQQPFLDLVHERVSEELAALEDVDITDCIVGEDRRHKFNLLKLQHYLWYQKTASNPRTLQHHCRFVIWKEMIPSKLKFIAKLPLPEKLLSYLLFECDEETNSYI